MVTRLQQLLAAFARNDWLPPAREVDYLSVGQGSGSPLSLVRRARQSRNHEGDRMLIDDIVACLHQHGQRVTYGGLTRALGYGDGAAQSVGNVMARRQKNHENSWVVAASTGRPTGYMSAQIDPRLPMSGTAIASPTMVLAWLAAHCAKVGRALE